MDTSHADYHPLTTAEITRRIISDVRNGVRVTVGFCDRHFPDVYQKLHHLIQNHPQFLNLITPILNRDPECEGDGDISFNLNNGHVAVTVLITSIEVGQDDAQIHTVLSLADFEKFIHLTSEFGIFATNGGDDLLTDI